MTAQKAVYLDTGVLRHLWKLQLGDWPKADNSHRKDAEHLRSFLKDAADRQQLSAVTSVFSVIEMTQFDQGKHYSRMRLNDGDDPLETLWEWLRPTVRWRKAKQHLAAVLKETGDDLTKWAESEDRNLITILQGPWENPAPVAELPSVLAFVLRLSLLTPIEPDDCFHVAYMLRYGNAIMTTDDGLVDALKRTLKNAKIMDNVRAEYLQAFHIEMSDPGFRVFSYPNQLKDVEQWCTSS